MSWNRPRTAEQLRHLPDESLCREVAGGNSVIRDPAEAEDLAQSLFLEVHTTMLGFNEKKGSFRSLLLRYAYTRSIDQRRRLECRRFYSNVEFEDVDPSMLVRDSRVTSGLSAEEGTHLIEQAMKQLDEKQRATVEAYFFRGLSLHEISQELGDSFGNVRHYLYRGLEKMRKLLDGAEQPEESSEREPSIAARLHRRVRTRLASEVSVVRARSI
jgi:RNA polymerase sigma factor (sigma-70 family)